MRKAIISGIALLSVVGLSSCGKMSEPFQDADRNASNTSSADTGTMPDGFSNYATKCDHGNRVYVLFHGNETYGSIAVVPQDASCKAGTQ